MVKMILMFLIGYLVGFVIHALCIAAKNNK